MDHRSVSFQTEFPIELGQLLEPKRQSSSMVNYLSPNQSLVLFALAGVDKELGPGPHAVASIIDRIWQNQLALHGDLEI